MNTLAQKVNINSIESDATLELSAISPNLADKLLKVHNSKGEEVLTVTNNGNIGIGVSDPQVGFDLRNSGDAPIIGIGATTQDPTVLGEGTLRYASAFSQLQYSDGNAWVRFTSSIERPYVLAINNYVTGSYPNDQTTRLDGFVKTVDSYNAYDQSTATYTVPIEGIYSLSFTVSFIVDWNNAILDNSYIQASWVASNGEQIKSVQYFPKGGKSQVSITCSGSLRLGVGDTVYPQIYHNLGVTKRLRVFGTTSDLNFNSLYIYAQ